MEQADGKLEIFTILSYNVKEIKFHSLSSLIGRLANDVSIGGYNHDVSLYNIGR